MRHNNASCWSGAGRDGAGHREGRGESLQSHPFVKAQLAKLPDSVLTGSTQRASTALQLDGAGQPLRALSDSTGHVYGLTTAVPHDGYLYLGTDHNGSNDVMRVRL